MALQSACEVALGAEDLQQACMCDVETLDDPSWTSLFETASDILADITQLPIGQCTRTWRPCMDKCAMCPCGCCQIRGIELIGFRPRLVEVKVDGVVVPSTEYAVLRTPGGMLSLERFYPNGQARMWPGCQNILLPDTAVGTFAVTIRAGLPIDWQVTQAAAEIACDLLRRWRDNLPDGITAMSVYGMQVDFRRYGQMSGDAAVENAGFDQVAKLMNRYPVMAETHIFAPELTRGWSYLERLDPTDIMVDVGP